MNRLGLAYRDAISSIRQIRRVNTPLSTCMSSNTTGFLKRKGGTNKCSLSKKPKPKPTSWTHKFVCLANTNDDRVPTTVQAKQSLAFADLGEKKVYIPDIDCPAQEFHECLYSFFPQLRNSGGFELMHCLPSTRDLEILPSPICQSPRLLRSRMSTARIYIRPIQKNLEVDKIHSSIEVKVCILSGTVENVYI